MINFYLMTRKIHRLFVLPIIALTILFVLTGMVLKFPVFFAPIIDAGFARYLHNQMSLFFAIFLTGMALTGAVMYFYPLLRRQSSK